MTITDDEGKPLPRDGVAFGHLKVTGPWVCARYYNEPAGPAHDDEGWFSTGDVATIDADGYMQITDRSKDVIKSGGEWISSIELENTAVAHPDVIEAAAIGIAHPNGTSGRCWWSSGGRTATWTGKRCSPSSRARSPNGGCPTMSSSSTSFPTPRPANC